MLCRNTVILTCIELLMMDNWAVEWHIQVGSMYNDAGLEMSRFESLEKRWCKDWNSRQCCMWCSGVVMFCFVLFLWLFLWMLTKWNAVSVSVCVCMTSKDSPLLLCFHQTCWFWWWCSLCLCSLQSRGFVCDQRALLHQCGPQHCHSQSRCPAVHPKQASHNCQCLVFWSQMWEPLVKVQAAWFVGGTQNAFLDEGRRTSLWHALDNQVCLSGWWPWQFQLLWQKQQQTISGLPCWDWTSSPFHCCLWWLQSSGFVDVECHWSCTWRYYNVQLLSRQQRIQHQMRIQSVHTLLCGWVDALRMALLSQRALWCLLALQLEEVAFCLGQSCLSFPSWSPTARDSRCKQNKALWAVMKHKTMWEDTDERTRHTRQMCWLSCGFNIDFLIFF